jgi:alpha-amylase
MNGTQRTLRSALIALLLLCVTGGIAEAGIMFQGFYWEPHDPGKPWWDHLVDLMPHLRNCGVTSIWVPSPCKGSSGGYSTGYDPYDWYDLGSKDQRGTVATRFGTKEQFLAMVAIAHAHGMDVYPEVVINHRDGGRDDGYIYDRLVGSEGVGRFTMCHNDFHHGGQGDWDRDLTGRDIAHEVPYVRDGFYRWIRWFDKQTGCDGYRLDAVKHMDPKFIEGLLWQIQEGSGQNRFAVGEYYDGNPWILQNWVNAVRRRSSVFDFTLFFRLLDMAHQNGYFDMRRLRERFWDTEKAVTFVNNHDTFRRANGLHLYMRANLAYAFILSAEGYPSVYYKDLFDDAGNTRYFLLNMMWIHTWFAHGRQIERWADEDLYILEREGNLIAAFNDNSVSWREAWVPTCFGPNVKLHDYTGDIGDRWTNNHGWVKVSVPPSGYVMLARDGFQTYIPCPPARRTIQEYEGNYDMDLRPAGEWWGEPIKFVHKVGERIEINCWLEDRDRTVHVALFDDHGLCINKAKGRGAVKLEYNIANATGWYQVRVGLEKTGKWHRSPYWLKIDYQGPEKLPKFYPPVGNCDWDLPKLDPPSTSNP